MTHLKKQLQLATPIYWPAWLGLGLLWLITRLPYRFQLGMGKGMGRLLYLFPTKLKHTAKTNITLCLPELTPLEQKALVRKNFESLGIGLIEAAMSWWLPDKKLQQLYKINGLEHVEQAFAKGKGILLLGPHFTCLEMVGRVLSMHYSFAVMYRPHKKPLIAFIHERFRKKHYTHHIPRHRMRDVIRTLQNNIAIWYAYDVDGGEKRSVFAPFFGVQTASLTAVSRIARLSDTTVVPIGFYRCEGKLGYEIDLHPPLENFPSDDLTEDAIRLNTTLESLIRKKPEQYVWQYKRFKTRPKGEPRIY